MMFATPVRYRYATNLKLSSIGRTPVNEVFPNIEDLVMSSCEFADFNEAVTSANEFVAELTVSMNSAVANADKYKMISEINPKFTSKETISKDWSEHEVAKLWIIDAIHQASHPGPMLAVALCQLLEVPEPAVMMN